LAERADELALASQPGAERGTHQQPSRESVRCESRQDRARCRHRRWRLWSRASLGNEIGLSRGSAGTGDMRMVANPNKAGHAVWTRYSAPPLPIPPTPTKPAVRGSDRGMVPLRRDSGVSGQFVCGPCGDLVPWRSTLEGSLPLTAV
jgi:hypothetical protein